MKVMALLSAIRESVGPRETIGLNDSTIEKFLAKDPSLAEAISEAHACHQTLRKEFGDLLRQPEKDVIPQLQADFLNFYEQEAVNPYVALVARGPWIVTAYGAVLHDSGGYGMLGLGHGPKSVIQAMAQNHTMANIMTPNFSQLRFTKRMLQEIGSRRNGSRRQPYQKFLCMNSGSEGMTVAARIADLNAKTLTEAGQRHANKTIKLISLKGSFHGRTERPAQVSDSSRAKYEKLASFRGFDQLVTVEPNNIAALEAAFADAEKNNVFFEAMFIEPVMGEGNPGMATTPEFYKRARELTAKMGTLFIVDSIQAGLRSHGYLSICDYPGFEDVEAPDMETYSKAINAGQYPLSVLALREPIAKMYVRGVYGNTMTANPRALEVACAVLDEITPEVRRNITERGKELLVHFAKLQQEFPGVVIGAQGTGLLCSLALKKEGYEVLGQDGVELYLRKNGIGVIHGGKNALRFTPHFRITSEEIQLVIDAVRQALKRGPVYR